MTDGLPDVPDWIEEKIEFNQDWDVQYHHIINVFQNEDRPFLSVSKIATELEMSDEWARGRLNELADIDVLNSGPGANGRVYWINHPETKWPKPPDVEIAPVEETDELTVSELTDRLDVRFAGGAAASAVLGSISILIAIAMAMTNSSLFDFEGQFFLFGMVISFVSAAFVVMAIAVWGYNQVKRRY